LHWNYFDYTIKTTPGGDAPAISKKVVKKEPLESGSFYEFSFSFRAISTEKGFFPWPFSKKLRGEIQLR